MKAQTLSAKMVCKLPWRKERMKTPSVPFIGQCYMITLIDAEKLLLQERKREGKIFWRVIPMKRKWWSQSGSNRRPPECHSGALPTELWPHDSAI